MYNFLQLSLFHITKKLLSIHELNMKQLKMNESKLLYMNE